MTLASELAALRSLSRRLSELWPAEGRLARLIAERQPQIGTWLEQNEMPRARWEHIRAAAYPHVYPAGRPRQRPPVEGRARRQDPAVPHPWVHSWMPSIAGVGPVVLRFATAAVKHLGAMPRDWRAARARRKQARSAERTGHAWYSIDASAPRCHRTTLGELAARYTPRHSDGSYNRHDARRWMRAFARNAVAQASDALDEGRPGARRLAIGALCSMIGLDDAIRLTGVEPRRWPGIDRTDPSVATGTALDAIVELHGLRRRTALEGPDATLWDDEPDVALRSRIMDMTRPDPGWWSLNQGVGMSWLDVRQPDPEVMMREIQSRLPAGTQIDDVDFDGHTGYVTVRYSTI